jgi:hypothetical protein
VRETVRLRLSTLILPPFLAEVIQTVRVILALDLGAIVCCCPILAVGDFGCVSLGGLCSPLELVRAKGGFRERSKSTESEDVFYSYFGWALDRNEPGIAWSRPVGDVCLGALCG